MMNDSQHAQSRPDWFRQPMPDPFPQVIRGAEYTAFHFADKSVVRVYPNGKVVRIGYDMTVVIEGMTVVIEGMRDICER